MHVARERTVSHAGSELGSVPKAEVVRRGFFALPGGTKAILAFVLSIFSYTIQTELAQVVQARLGYKKPFLSLWLGHSLFITLLPGHLLFLVRTTQYPLSHWLSLIAKNLDWQLSAHPDAESTPALGSGAYEPLPTERHGAGSQSSASRGALGGAFRPASVKRGSGLRTRVRDLLGFDMFKLLKILFILTVGITIPSLSWYAAVPMTSMADITAVYNTFSVFALVFSVMFLGEEWERRKVISVGLASIGVAIVAYGGASPEKGKSEFSNPLLGSLLALLGALTMGAYEVIFTLIAKLPDEEAQERIYARPGSRRTRSRTISGAWLRSPTARRFSSDAAPGAATAPAAGAGRRSGRAPDVRVVFDAADGDLGKDYSTPSPLGGAGSVEPKDTSPPSHERTALVVVDDAVSSARTSYEAIPSRNGNSGTQQAQQSYSGPHSPTLHGPSPLRQTYHIDNSNSSASDLFSSADTAPLPNRLRTAQGSSGLASSAFTDFAADSETESELQDGEEEEILAGATRLSRSVSRSSATPAALASPGLDRDDDEDDFYPSHTHAGLHGDDGAAGSGRARSERGAGVGGSGPQPDGWARQGYLSDAHVWIPPPLPFGLHATIMTSGIGIVTLCVLWVGVVIGHWTGLEPFEFPPNLRVVAALLGVGLLGVLFNGTFTLLLGLWGPVLASVSIIGATVLVEIADVVLGHPLRIASVLGCALIVAGFVVLVSGTEEVVEDVGGAVDAGDEGARPAVGPRTP